MQPVTTARTRRQLPLDEVEWELLRIFEDVLESPNLGATADFFVSGGDSLTAARVFSAIAERLHVELPLTTLIEAPTVRKLARTVRHARRLRDGNAPPIDRPRVPLSGGGSPLFFAPAAGADAFTLHEISKALAPRVRVIGMAYPGLDRTRPFLSRVDDLVDRFLPHVLALQPDGPIRVAGSSFGGLVARELARRLRAAGRTGDLVALLDTYAPGYPRRRPGLRATWAAVLRRLMPPLQVDEPFSADLLGEGMRMKRRAIAMRLRLMASRRLLLPKRGERFLWLYEACVLAKRRYRPQPYPGDAVLFRASVQPSSAIYRDDPMLGWTGLFAGKFDIIEYPGMHADHLRAPVADTIAGELVRRCAAEER